LDTKKREGGEIATVLTVGVATLSTGGAVLAVSDNTANNATFAVAILTIIGILLSGATVIYKRGNQKLQEHLIAVIREQTKPIQPDANGGRSLVDLHKKVDEGFRQANDRIDTTEERQVLMMQTQFALQEQVRDIAEVVRPYPSDPID
jgi:uncharacterized protein HemX